MKLEWTSVAGAHLNIWSADMDQLALVVAPSNQKRDPFKWVVAEGDNVLGEGFSKDLDLAMSNASVKGIEIRNSRRELEETNRETLIPVEETPGADSECYAAGSGENHSHVGDIMVIDLDVDAPIAEQIANA